MPAQKSAKKKKLSPWNILVKKVSKQYPNKSFVEVVQIAKRNYKK